MGDGYLLGLDVGSSSTKGVLVDFVGNIISSHSIIHSFVQPEASWAEQNPDEIWWPECIEIIRNCIKSIEKDKIKGIAITGMVPNLCPLDQEGKIVRPAILYRDNRAIKECEFLNAQYGLNFNLQDILPKWYWLKLYEPYNYQNINIILNTHSYLVYKLTGNYSIDCDTANLFGEIFDLNSLSWNKELIKKIGLDPKVLPPIYKPTDIVGKIKKEISLLTGLNPNTPVFAGNGDSLMSMIGSGVVDKNDAMLYIGTAATLISTTAALEALASGPAFNSGYIHFIANVLTGGELLKWYKEKLQIKGTELSHLELERLSVNITPGANGLIVLPHLEGKRTPLYNPFASGCILGLNSKHTGAHLYRAILESMGYALQESIMEKRHLIKRLVISGGGAKNKLLRQILADILDMPIEYNPKSEAALGIAYFAGYANGIFEDFSKIKSLWLPDSEVIKPNPKNTQVYKEYYQVYKNISLSIDSLYPMLMDLKKGDSDENRCICG